MEYTGDMDHYLSLYSFMTITACHVFSASFIPPDPWQSKGFIRSKKYFTMNLYSCPLYVQRGMDGLMSYVMWLDVTRS